MKLFGFLVFAFCILPAQSLQAGLVTIDFTTVASNTIFTPDPGDFDTGGTYTVSVTGVENTELGGTIDFDLLIDVSSSFGQVFVSTADGLGVSGFGGNGLQTGENLTLTASVTNVVSNTGVEAGIVLSGGANPVTGDDNGFTDLTVGGITFGHSLDADGINFTSNSTQSVFDGDATLVLTPNSGVNIFATALTLNITGVPEPSALALSLPLFGMLLRRRKRRTTIR